MIDEQLLKAAHSSLCITFGTMGPYAIGTVSAERIGYAQDPCVVVTVTCRDEDLSSLVPITRQHVYRELAERGWTPDDVAFVPSTQRGRRRRFVDQNETSKTCGCNKMGTEYRFSFRMEREFARATFVGFGSFRKLPTRTFTSDICPTCRGTGGGQYNDCSACDGNGVV